VTSQGAGERYNASTLLDRVLERGLAGKTAIEWSSGSLTYLQLYARVCQAMRTFSGLGIRREDRVLLVLDDSPTFVAGFLGAIRMGAIPVPVNPLLQRSEDYDHYFHDSLARLVVVDDLTAPRVTAAAARAELRPPVLHESPFDAADASPLPPASTRRDDMAFWLYSSGSTGKPKAVVHLQHDIPYTCETYAAQVLGIREDDSTFSTTKLFHAYGLGNNLTFPLWAGATSVLLSGRPTPPAVLQTVAEGRPTLFFSAPTLYNALLNFPDFDDYDLSSIRRCVSAAESLPAEVWRRWKERTGLTILDGIGSTEMLHIYCSNRLDDVTPGSSGKPVPGYEIELLDEEGSPVPRGETGELCVKGDSALALYWGQHEKTKRSIRGEWFSSGDRYRQDGQGNYWYEGRADDVIKISGLWVSPTDIEAALIEHPAVTESAVVGFADSEGLTKIRAFVILKAVEPSAGLVAELQEHSKSRLQRYQYPHEIVFVDDLPRTVTGKIQRFKLREPAPVQKGNEHVR
jgi:benzoate-CoA ligase family protein